MSLVNDWIPAFPTYLLALVALFLPGAIAALAAGIRGKTLLIVALPLSTFLIAVGAIVASLVGLQWGWLALALFTALISAISWVCQRYVAAFRVERDNSLLPVWLRWELALGIGIVAFLVAWEFVRAVQAPGRPPQTWDAMFHLSAVRRILETGDGSTFVLGTLNNPLADYAFYPAGWHDLVSLLVPPTGDVVVASNMASLAILTVVWPLGAGLLASTLFNDQRYVGLSAVLIAAAMTAFPFRVASLGTLWPVLYAYALVPYVLAIALLFFGAKTFAVSPRLLLILLASLIGIGITHPQGALAFVLLGVWLVFQVGYRVLRGKQTSTTSGKVLLAAVVPALILVLYAMSRTAGGQSATGFDRRSPVGRIRTEVWGIVFDSQLSWQGYGNPDPKYLLAALLFVGAVVAVRRRRQIWVLFGFATAAYLFLVTASMSLPGYWLTGFWYYDPPRLGAIIPLLYVPIAALGMASICGWLVRFFSGKWSINLRSVQLAFGVITAGSLVLGTGFLSREANLHQLWINYQYKAEDGLNGTVSDEELAMIRRLPDELPDDAVILGDPFVGASLLYSVAGLNAVHKYFDDLNSPTERFLSNNFEYIRSDPEICEILNERGIEYFYTDSVRYKIDLRYYADMYIGLVAIRQTDILDEFELIDQGGTAKLYKITGCD